VRIPSTDESLIGRIVDVKIKHAADFSVAGELVEQLQRMPV
jgi:hypothetical protein